jgi:hypothetical protein
LLRDRGSTYRLFVVRHRGTGRHHPDGFHRCVQHHSSGKDLSRSDSTGCRQGDPGCSVLLCGHPGYHQTHQRFAERGLCSGAWFGSYMVPKQTRWRFAPRSSLGHGLPPNINTCRVRRSRQPTAVPEEDVVLGQPVGSTGFCRRRFRRGFFVHPLLWVNCAFLAIPGLQNRWISRSRVAVPVTEFNLLVALKTYNSRSKGNCSKKTRLVVFLLFGAKNTKLRKCEIIICRRTNQIYK